ncbi:hypothetical protein [Terrabacter sp. 2RAF25]|uniref:hypothetical protein n=1 Tax=Terrabacter sp. 2RAF25 TaxID=3232998 RepID=UPI003F9BAF6F
MSSTTTRRRGLWIRALVAAAVAVAALPLTAAPSLALPQAPSGLSPAGGVTTTPTPVLAWQPATAATRYDVEVSSAPDYSSNLVSMSTTNTRLVPTSVLPEGPVYWRVRSVDSTGTGTWATASFTVLTTPPPVPLSPPNGAEPLAQPANPPLLSWTAVQGAVGYEIDVDVDTDFIGASTYSTKTTSLVVPDAKADGTYNWRVRAQLSNGRYTRNSSVWSYRIGPLAQVTPSLPAEGAAVEDIVLAWEPVPGAKTYELQVSTDQDFNTIIDSKTNIKSTRYSPPTTYLNDQYYWRVRARNLQGETYDWQLVTPKRLFQRNWLDQPTLQHPESTLSPPTGDDFYFQWTPVQHATRYQVDLGTDPNFSPGTYRTCETASTTYTAGYLGQDACLPTQGRVYYWRVRAIDAPANVQGLYSAIRSFVYSSSVVTQTQPADGATVSVPTLEWAAARDVERYRVVLANASGDVIADTTTYSLSWTPTTTLDPARGPYAWTVQTITADGRMSPRYPPRTFSLASATIPTSPSALTPLTAGSSTARLPNLTWQPMAGAAYYRVDIRISGSGFWFEDSYAPILSTRHVYPAATDTSAQMLAPATYDYQVEAFTSSNASLGRGDVGHFTIAELPRVSGQRIALNGSALDAGLGCSLPITSPATDPDPCHDVPTTPVLDWDPVPEAAYYMVYLARDRELTNLVYTDPPRTTSSRWTPAAWHGPMALPDSQAGQAYYWYVRPCKANGICAPDPVSTLAAADHGFSKTSPPVSLTAPASGAQVADDVTFTWADYLTTNQSTAYDATAERGTQTAMRYHIQVSQTRSFATLIDDQFVDQATYTAWDRTYPEGPLYWRVQAIDAAGNGLSWSVGDQVGQAGWSFRKLSPPPALLSPVGDAVTDGLAPFRWQPANYAGNYVLEVYKNDDTNWSPVNRVLTFTGRQVAYAHSVPLQASSSAYVWRVARLDADNLPGAWSQTGRFFSAGAAPTLTSPTSGAVMSQSSPYFSWTTVPGAVTYRFERRAPEATNQAENVSTSAQAWAPTSALPLGVWEWRVVAVDTNRGDLGASEWRRFTAMGTLTPTPTPTVTGSPRVGSTLTANTGTWGPGAVTLTYQWYRSGAAITGARASTYKLTAGDLAQKITVTVTGQQAGYTPVTRSSAPTGPVAAGTLTPAPTPTVAGTVRVGSRIVARPGTWGPGMVTLSYQWFRTGTPVAGATTSSYLLGPADLGKSMRVQVVGRAVGYASATRSSANTAAVALGLLVAPTPTLTGTARVGSRLTLRAGTWGPAPVSLSYQWYRSGVAITGARGTSYVLQAADRGRTVKVAVTGRKASFATTVRLSPATSTVAG